VREEQNLDPRICEKDRKKSGGGENEGGTLFQQTYESPRRKKDLDRRAVNMGWRAGLAGDSGGFANADEEEKQNRSTGWE